MSPYQHTLSVCVLMMTACGGSASHSEGDPKSAACEIDIQLSQTPNAIEATCVTDQFVIVTCGRPASNPGGLECRLPKDAAPDALLSPTWCCK